MRSNVKLELQNTIRGYIKRNLPIDKNKAVTGVVHSGRVIVGNSSYPFIPAVDIFFGDGDRVACLLPDSGNIAAVVGVF